MMVTGTVAVQPKPPLVRYIFDVTFDDPARMAVALVWYGTVLSDAGFTLTIVGLEEIKSVLKIPVLDVRLELMIWLLPITKLRGDGVIPQELKKLELENRKQYVA